MRIGYRNPDSARGFTLIELIVILTIIGILAAVAAPRFFSRTTYDTAAFSDKAASMLRYAQKSAIAKRRKVCVALSSNNVTLSFALAPGAASPCDHPLSSPTGDAQFAMDTPSGVSLATTPNTTAFSFDAAGRPSFASRLELQIAGDETYRLYVEPETGYVHR